MRQKSRGRSGDKASGTDVFHVDSGSGHCNRAGIFVYAVLKRERKEESGRDGAEIFRETFCGKGGEIMWRIRQFFACLKDEKGIGVVEVILILVVLIGLVIIFKSQLTSLVNSIFQKITSESSGI